MMILKIVLIFYISGQPGTLVLVREYFLSFFKSGKRTFPKPPKPGKFLIFFNEPFPYIFVTIILWIAFAYWQKFQPWCRYFQNDIFYDMIHMTYWYLQISLLFKQVTKDPWNGERIINSFLNPIWDGGGKGKTSINHFKSYFFGFKWQWLFNIRYDWPFGTIFGKIENWE